MVVSCDDYLDIQPKGELIPASVEEYDYMLIGDPMVTSPIIQHLLNDQVNPFMEMFWAQSWKNIYHYTDKFLTETENDMDWNASYQTVFVANTILDEMKSFGDSADKERIIAEAKMHRAYKFFMLVNLYSKHYDAATAATDLGIPLLLTSSFTDDYHRATVEEVYKQVIDDVTESIDALPATQKNRVRPSKAAAYGLLSRVYLYMSKFDLAQKNAEKSLSFYDNIHDMNNGFYPYYVEKNDEMTWAKYARTMGKWNCWVSSFVGYNPTTLTKFESGDIRSSQFMPFGAVTYYKYSSRLAGITVPELYLNIAECKARKNDVQGALDALDHIRMYRFDSADYEEIDAASVANIFDRVYLERERELFAQGHRFFDIKRFNAEGRMNMDFVRMDATGEIGRLKANTSDWIMDIPSIIISNFKKDLQPNS